MSQWLAQPRSSWPHYHVIQQVVITEHFIPPPISNYRTFACGHLLRCSPTIYSEQALVLLLRFRRQYSWNRASALELRAQRSCQHNQFRVPETKTPGNHALHRWWKSSKPQREYHLVKVEAFTLVSSCTPKATSPKQIIPPNSDT